ncbi:MAG TPA: phospholipid carrier-dependent glycosyltransferase, partial [bacterium]|nr:phospholipid carrier-dependent glycosyltransferase [bacterium]
MGKKPVSKKKETKGSKKGLFLIFALILLAGLILRLYQPDWYHDRQFHPDERWIVGQAVPQLSYPDRPIGMQYGSLPLYILSFYKDFINGMKNIDRGKALIGGARAISGIFDAGTIVFVFLICMLLFKPAVAMLASLMLAFTALHIHAAHFFTVDTFVTFFAAGTVYFSVRIYKKGEMIDYILAGVFYAAALASKSAAIPVGFAIAAAHLLNFFSINGKTAAASEKRYKSWMNLAWSGLSAFAAFFAFMPHAILNFEAFVRDQTAQRDILVTGKADIPYNRQYLGTLPY